MSKPAPASRLRFRSRQWPRAQHRPRCPRFRGTLFAATHAGRQTALSLPRPRTRRARTLRPRPLAGLRERARWLALAPLRRVEPATAGRGRDRRIGRRGAHDRGTSPPRNARHTRSRARIVRSPHRTGKCPPGCGPLSPGRKRLDRLQGSACWAQDGRKLYRQSLAGGPICDCRRRRDQSHPCCAEMLEPLGFEIEEAADGAACLDRCAAAPFDAR